jgi:putative ubiquitin-RnfH superfamily antitoxin RatB of RatAB toxin-antitoxin module
MGRADLADTAEGAEAADVSRQPVGAGWPAGAATAAALIAVEVVYSPAPREVEVYALTLPAGSAVDAALKASGLWQRHPQLDMSALSFSVWGRSMPLDHVLRERDRVEVCRALTVDPKEARRLRYKRQGPRRPRPGAQAVAGGDGVQLQKPGSDEGPDAGPGAGPVPAPGTARDP